MKFHILLSIFFLNFIPTATSDFVNFGDGQDVPFISVTTTFEKNILTTTTSWLIIRKCDKFTRKDVVTSSKGQVSGTKSSCVHGKVCDFPARLGPPAENPITCDVFVKNF